MASPIFTIRTLVEATRRRWAAGEQDLDEKALLDVFEPCGYELFFERAGDGEMLEISMICDVCDGPDDSQKLTVSIKPTDADWDQDGRIERIAQYLIRAADELYRPEKLPPVPDVDPHKHAMDGLSTVLEPSEAEPIAADVARVTREVLATASTSAA
jgi:hypothetical protein